YGWQNIDNDPVNYWEDYYSWLFNADEGWWFYYFDMPPYGGVSINSFSSSEDGADDWIITEALLPVSGDSLIFYSNYYSGDPSDTSLVDTIHVYASNGGNTIADFTTEIGEVLMQGGYTDTSTRLAYSLEAYAGSAVYLAIVHHGSVGDPLRYIMVDGIFLPERLVDPDPILVLSAAVAPYTPELAEPGFEGGEGPAANGVPDGWNGWQSTWDGWGSSHIATVNTDVYAGDYAVELGVDDGNGFAVVWPDGDFSAQGGQTWTFSAWIKDVSSGGAGGDFAALKMEFWYADYSGYIEEVVYPEGVSSSWQQFTASYTLPAETGIIRAVLVVTGSDDGNDVAYQFDDVELNRTQLASFDMGRTYEGLTVTDSITIFNAGGSDLVITDISSDNNVFTLSASSATIALDGFLSIAVTFTPTAPENYTGHIVLTSNSASSPDTVTVVGVADHSLLLSDASLDLNTYPGLTVTESFTISNAGGADLVITDISIDNDAFILSGSNATVISSGNYIDMSVSLSPMAGQSYTGNIVITSSSGSSPDIVNLYGGSYSTWGG
ncbi:MAG TPA: choice-of-anchor D domain-containing protein, partial [Gemmatimonadetes bacterium]|nr:choice-of-anchor D domain-containing protein [Gemmatimonadota bacterium]